MHKTRAWVPGLFALTAWLLYLLSVQFLQQVPREPPAERMRVSLPVLAQLLTAGGDRYLASNLGAYRAIVVGTGRLDGATYATLARVQKDAAWLNPAHEDNYYTATAILPWHGYLLSTQEILQRAIEARPQDVYPPFFYGFHKLYFDHDNIAAARYVAMAAQRAEGGNRVALLNIAGKWAARANDAQVAVNVLTALRAQAHNPELKIMFGRRIEQVKILDMLRSKAREYEQQSGRPLQDLSQLVEAGLLKQIPEDPVQLGFAVDKSGWPIIKNP